MTELARRIDRTKFQVHVACLKDRGDFRARITHAGLGITEFPMRTFASVGAARQVIRFAAWCRHHRFAVVHACDFYANILALPGAWLARVPVRIGSRRDVMMPERSAAQARLQTVAYRFAHRVIANSAAAATQLRSEGVVPAAIGVISNGLDLERAPRTRTGGSPLVTTVANLRPGKGHEILIDAAAEVTRKIPGVTFALIGDGSRRGELEHYAASRGLSGVIRFEGHRSNVKEILANSDVFAFPSFMEAAPNAVMEAMAAGVPVVATNVGGIPEVVNDGESGLLVPPADSRSLAEALLRVLSDPSMATRLGAAGRATVEARFGFERMVGEFEALYLGELAKRLSREDYAFATSSQG